MVTRTRAKDSVVYDITSFLLSNINYPHSSFVGSFGKHLFMHPKLIYGRSTNSNSTLKSINSDNASILWWSVSARSNVVYSSHWLILPHYLNNFNEAHQVSINPNSYLPRLRYLTPILWLKAPSSRPSALSVSLSHARPRTKMREQGLFEICAILCPVNSHRQGWAVPPAWRRWICLWGPLQCQDFDLSLLCVTIKYLERKRNHHDSAVSIFIYVLMKKRMK
jgi:hypothetical protein